MNRLTFLKRLLGGVAAAPVLAKALTEEKAPLPLPFFPSGGNRSLTVHSFSVTSGYVTPAAYEEFAAAINRAYDADTKRALDRLAAKHFQA